MSARAQFAGNGQYGRNVAAAFPGREQKISHMAFHSFEGMDEVEM
jgi:hypothetical protein